MTTPSGVISLSDVASELSVSTTGLNLNQTNVRRLAGKPSGAVSLDDLRSKTWITNLGGVQTAGRCYSAQSGFSVDRYGTDGDIILTMGVWPTDPPNCQTIPWQYLQFGGVQNAASYPRYSFVWTLNLSTLGVGNSTYTRAPNWPYTNVSWTYYITRTSVNTATIQAYGTFGTGDTGTQISVNNWYGGFVSDLGGGSDTFTLTWTSVGY